MSIVNDIWLQVQLCYFYLAERESEITEEHLRSLNNITAYKAGNWRLCNIIYDFVIKNQNKKLSSEVFSYLKKTNIDNLVAHSIKERDLGVLKACAPDKKIILLKGACFNRTIYNNKKLIRFSNDVDIFYEGYNELIDSVRDEFVQVKTGIGVNSHIYEKTIARRNKKKPVIEIHFKLLQPTLFDYDCSNYSKKKIRLNDGFYVSDKTEQLILILLNSFKDCSFVNYNILDFALLFKGMNQDELLNIVSKRINNDSLMIFIKKYLELVSWLIGGETGPNLDKYKSAGSNKIDKILWYFNNTKDYKLVMNFFLSYLMRVIK